MQPQLPLIEYYYAVYTDAVHALARMGYSQGVVYMCSSTAGLSFQSYLIDQADKLPQSLLGTIFCAPFWTPRLPLDYCVVTCLLRALARVFPQLIITRDPVGARWLEQLVEKATRSGRSVKVDPELNPIDNKPVFVEWLLMVSEAQCHLRHWVGSQRPDERRLPALLLTSDQQELDPHVDIEAVHRMWHRMYPVTAAAAGIEVSDALRVPGAEHDLVLSQLKPYELACDAINRFITQCQSQARR